MYLWKGNEMKGNKFIKRLISGCMAAMLVAGSMYTDMPVMAAVNADDTVSVNAVEVIPRSVDQQIPEDAIKLSNGHYYYFYENSVTWNAAEEACEALGGHLITATTEEEVEYIKEIGNSRIWLGGFRDGLMKWFWVTGESFDYTNGQAPWNNGEPNSSAPDGETRLMFLDIGWNDSVKNDTMYYICEWDEYTEFLTEDVLEEKHILGMLEDESQSKSWGNHRYVFINYYQSLSWLEAEKLCEKYNGHLFTVNSDEEVEINDYFKSLGMNDVWIGGFRDSRTNWRWVTGESFDFANEYCNNDEHSKENHISDLWGRGEPNGVNNYAMENRIELHSAGWNDINNVDVNPRFILEVDDYHKMIYPGDVEAFYAAEDTYCEENGHVLLDSTSYDYKDETTHTRTCYLCGQIAETTEHIIEYNECTGEEHKGECIKCGHQVEGEHVLNEDGECKICGSYSLDKKNTIVTSVEDLTYTGSEQFPSISIFDGQEKLVKDTDYSFTEEKKVNAGKYSIEMVGVGKYYGTKTVDWSIEKAQPVLAFTKLSDDDSAIKGVTVSVSPQDATAKIVVEYKDADGKWTTKLPEKAGKYAVRAYMPEESDNLLAVAEEKAVVAEYVINDTSCKHDYDGQSYIGAGNGTHYKECKLCYEKSEAEKCTPGQAVIENDEEVVYCVVCKDELSRNKIEQPEQPEIKPDVKPVVSENKIVGKIVIDNNGSMNMTAEVPEKVIYTGKKITFADEFTAIDSEGKVTTLANGTDYKISYKKNINAGEAQIIIKGLGEYKKAGTVRKTFAINAVDISDKYGSKVLASDLCFADIQKSKVKANVNITFNGKKLKNKKDYTLKLVKEDGSEVACTAKTKLDDNCMIKITGNKNFAGDRIISVIFKASDDDRQLLSDATVTGISAQKYTGKPVEFDFSKVSVNAGEALEYGKDYTVEYYNNVAVGMAAVKLSATADSAKVTGSKLVTFKIYGSTMSAAAVKLTVNGKQIGMTKDMQIAFNGDAIIPEVEVRVGSDVLVKDVDYSVSFAKNRKAGTAQVIITGKGGYTGTKKVKFKISK